MCEDSWCLFADDSAAQLQADGSLYLRSDDEQRTIMSGQVSGAHVPCSINVLKMLGSTFSWTRI